jgi:hypothetical protein
MNRGFAINKLRAQTQDWMRQSLADIRQSWIFAGLPTVAFGALCLAFYAVRRCYTCRCFIAAQPLQPGTMPIAIRPDPLATLVLTKSATHASIRESLQTLRRARYLSGAAL